MIPRNLSQSLAHRRVRRSIQLVAVITAAAAIGLAGVTGSGRLTAATLVVAGLALGSLKLSLVALTASVRPTPTPTPPPAAPHDDDTLQRALADIERLRADTALCLSQTGQLEPSLAHLASIRQELAHLKDLIRDGSGPTPSA